MIQAGCEGVIDYSTANLLDPRWWQKLWYVLEYLERQGKIKLDEYQFDFHRSAFDYQSEQTAADLHWNNAEQAHNRLIASVQPWTESGATSAAEAAAHLRQKWIDKWGDPSSPETKAKVQEIIDYWEEQRAKKRNARHGTRL